MLDKRKKNQTDQDYKKYIENLHTKVVKWRKQNNILKM